MQIKDALRKLDLGASVAEFDQALENYFVETQTFHELVRGTGDVVAGDKGTGKTALYKVLRSRYPGIPELSKIEIIPAFNPSGNPVFQRLADAPELNEGMHLTVWKSFVLSLVGNWVLQLWDGAYTDTMFALDELLQALGLRASDDSASTVFAKVVNWAKRLLNPTSAEVAITFTENGMPIVAPTFRFEKFEPEEPESGVVTHEQALGLLNHVLEDADITVWVALDRLDEAFVGHPTIERLALRGLLRTYLDLQEFSRIRLKLFLRNDLFRRIVEGGFVNLTHVNAKRIDILWDEPDLLNLLCSRIRENPVFLEDLGLAGLGDEELFYAVFPDQVDAGERKPKTWSWMMSRISDGNGVRPPRNLIDLVKKAQEAQLRKENREPRSFEPGTPLIESESIKRALTALSEQRVEDTLIAEAGSNAALIERFRDGKAEHNTDSLSRVLGIEKEAVRQTIKPLVELGFLEQVGSSFKVPMLYRDGLAIAQGKAF